MFEEKGWEWMQQRGILWCLMVNTVYLALEWGMKELRVKWDDMAT